jgi:hypothetical protein
MPNFIRVPNPSHFLIDYSHVIFDLASNSSKLAGNPLKG